MSERLPEKLRAKVAQDLRPVRPVAAPSVRLLLVMLWTAAVLVAVPALMGLRFNAPQLGFWLLWGATALEAVAGLSMVFLALREGIPALGAPRGTLVSALLGAWVLQLGVALFTHARCPCPAGAGLGDVVCLTTETFLGIPALFLTLVLVVRAYPLSPPQAGLLGGVGAGLLADAVQHLVCPVSDLRHVLVWHLGAVALLGLLGLAFGFVWEGLRLRRFRKDLEEDP